MRIFQSSASRRSCGAGVFGYWLLGFFSRIVSRINEGNTAWTGEVNLEDPANIPAARAISNCFIIMDLQPITKRHGRFLAIMVAIFGGFKAKFSGIARKATNADLKTLCAIQVILRERPSQI